MEDQYDALSNHDVRQLWTRFEGLVGHQLNRLQVDGNPNSVGAPLSPSKAASFGACPAGRSSSMCSMVASDLSSLTTATSPARLLEKCNPVQRESCVDGHSLESIGDQDGYLVEDDDGGGGGTGGVYSTQDGGTGKEDVFLGSPVDGCVDMDVAVGDPGIAGSCVDGDIGSDGEDEADGGGGDGVGLDSSLSCCLIPSDGSSTSQASLYSGEVKRDASSNAVNAVNSCESQPLFGLPYVARAAGPLLSLLMVTLDECDGKGGPLADTLLKLKEKSRECKRNMIGVYKQSLLLESQLHQYLNPGLVTSLNRRVARATFDADMMSKLVDSLKKESRKSMEDPRRKSKMLDVCMRIKALLGRQKCEWQCVGRLKETLTMAKEMKQLLRFIARLSNTLERSKTAFGGLQDRPPPYEYCSPYTDIPKIINDENSSQKKTDSSDKESDEVFYSKDDFVEDFEETTGQQGQDNEVKVTNQAIYSNSKLTDLSSAVSESGWTTGSGDQSACRKRWRRHGRSIKNLVSSRGRSLSPRKLSRSPGPNRSKSTDFEIDSYSSYRDSNVMSSAKEGLSANSNESKSVVFDLPCVNITKDVCAGRQWVVNQVSRVGDIGSCFRYDLPSRRHPGCLGTQPLVNQRACRDFEQGGGGRGSETMDERNGTNGFRTTGKTVKNGSPPRACPRNSKPCRESQNDDHGTCNGDQGGTCPIDRDGSSGCHRTRWDDGFTQDQTKLSDLEGDHYYITASGHYAGKNVSDSERESSVISESSREHRKETPQEKRSEIETDKDQSLHSESIKESHKQSAQGARDSEAKSLGTRAESLQSAVKGSVRSKTSISQSPRRKGSQSPSQRSRMGGSQSPSQRSRIGGSQSPSQKSRARSMKSSDRRDDSEGGTPDDMEESPPSCEDSGGSNGSGGSNSILIDIESEYPNDKKSKSSSCPPGCRRIRVAVKKRGSSTSAATKRKSADPETKRISERPSDKPSERPSSQPETFDRDKYLNEDEETRAPGDGYSESEPNQREETPGAATESVVKSFASSAPPDILLQAEPTPPPSPKRKESSVKAPPSPMPSIKAPTPPPTPPAAPITPEPVPSQSGRGSNWQGSLQDLAANVEVPYIGRADEPWKLVLAGLLLLLLASLLLSFLGNTCCGCGYFPNPFFFLTNSLATRVTLRHNGLAPT